MPDELPPVCDSPPSPPENPPAMLPSAPGKRRTAAAAAAVAAAAHRSVADLPDPPPAKLAAFAAPSHISSAESLPFCDSRSSRRKRFVIYSVICATMFALSSVLDIRRAELKNRHPKVQLSLPTGSALSSLAESAAQPAPPQTPVHVDTHGRPPADPADPNLSLRPFDPAHPPANPPAPPANGSPRHPDSPAKDEASSPTLSSGSALHPAAASDPDGQPKSDPKLSDQELKDDVDQFIAHVDEEASHDSNTTAGAAPQDPAELASAGPQAVPGAPAAPGVPPASSGSSGSSSITSTTLDSLRPAPAGGSVSDPASAAEEAPGAPVNTSMATEGDVRLSSEDMFANAQTRLKVLLEDEELKKYADENELRVLQALALQATRGNCEQKSGSEGGSLFKTDEEAASSVDIERTDPLWGAWCMFMGGYKTDAMRDYVTKRRVVEEQMLTAKAKAETNSTAPAPPFDPNAASLDDVMTPEQQSELRKKTDTLTAHLQPYDARFLAALSLQAAFGDCGPYGKELDIERKEGEEPTDLRKLREPLLDQTVVRGEGAQWGAWCVLQGTKRTQAASELARKVGSLVEQLSKSQAGSVPVAAQDNSAEVASVRFAEANAYAEAQLGT